MFLIKLLRGLGGWNSWLRCDILRTRFRLKNSKERDHLGSLGIDGSVILKCTFKKYSMKAVVNGNSPSGSVKGGGIDGLCDVSVRRPRRWFWFMNHCNWTPRWRCWWQKHHIMKAYEGGSRIGLHLHAFLTSSLSGCIEQASYRLGITFGRYLFNSYPQGRYWFSCQREVP
jgi:hypothetical protein